MRGVSQTALVSNRSVDGPVKVKRALDSVCNAVSKRQKGLTSWTTTADVITTLNCATSKCEDPIEGDAQPKVLLLDSGLLHC